MSLGYVSLKGGANDSFTLCPYSLAFVIEKLTLNDTELDDTNSDF